MPKLSIPEKDTLGYKKARDNLIISLSLSLYGVRIKEDNAEYAHVAKLADAALVSLTHTQKYVVYDPENLTAGQRATKIARPILSFIPQLTFPLWGWAFKWYMNPGKAQKIDYEIYRREVMGEEPEHKLDTAVIKHKRKTEDE